MSEVIDLLIDEGAEAPLNRISSFLTDMDLLRFSQVCQKWRNACKVILKPIN